MPDYQKTKVACYLGLVTQAISANFAPLLFLKFHKKCKKLFPFRNRCVRLRESIFPDGGYGKEEETR